MNPLLKSYIPTAEMIAGTFGDRCEVVIHDLTQPESSVVYVVNGKVSGRRIGQSFDHLVKNVLLNKDFERDRVMNYHFTTDDGRLFKSSSSLIRDENGTVVGMLCVNYDISHLRSLQQELNSFLGETGDQDNRENNELPQDVAAIFDDLLMRIVGKQDVKNLSRKKSVDLIRFMDEKGIFLVKGAVDKVAKLLGVSKVTVYSYLDEAKK